MRRSALQVLVCPDCHGPLECRDVGEDLPDGALLCPRDGTSYRITNGIPLLVRSGSVERLASFGRNYSGAWSRDGWGGADPSYLLALPYQDVTARATSRWKVKARSMEALLSLLGELRPHRILDLGCGVGWLSYHLAGRGYEVYAVDAVLDEVLGLGAASAYIRAGAYFERVWGELGNPPFRSEAFDAVICNASLHYGKWEDTIAAVARILRAQGAFIVMNSPVHRQRRSAARAATAFQTHLRRLGADEEVAGAYHHLERGSLEAALVQFIGPVREQPFDPGFGFRSIRSLKGLALRMELARFPILWARRASAG